MSHAVYVHFVGGAFDGHEITYWRGDFERWEGIRPAGWFGSYRRRSLYQADTPYHDGDATVTMSLVAIARVVGAIDDDDSDESSYHGWLAPCDQYDDSERSA